MNNEKGFSLIELIIVVAILGVITAVAVPAYINYLYTSRLNADIATARELARSAELYCGTKGLSAVPDSFAWSEENERIPRTASNGEIFSYTMIGNSVYVTFDATEEKAGKYSGPYKVGSYGSLPVPTVGGMPENSNTEKNQ